MKLSQAIEDALLTGKYSAQDEFMCTVLGRQYSEKLKLQLGRHLNRIFPGNKGCGPLITELWLLAGGCFMEPAVYEIFWSNSIKRTTEWYVWFVFDLKRKGL